MHWYVYEYNIEATKKDISHLVKKKSWEQVNRHDIPPGLYGKPQHFINGDWALKLKFLSNGSTIKYKSCYCVRGDIKTAGVEYFKTYAPVVQWSTVCIALTIIISNNWNTKQLYYTNAFDQEDLKEEVYIDPPLGFGGSYGISNVLRLITILYGIWQSPKTLFDKLRCGLLEQVFIK